MNEPMITIRMPGERSSSHGPSTSSPFMIELTVPLEAVLNALAYRAETGGDFTILRAYPRGPIRFTVAHEPPRMTPLCEAAKTVWVVQRVRGGDLVAKRWIWLEGQTPLPCPEAIRIGAPVSQPGEPGWALRLLEEIRSRLPPGLTRCEKIPEGLPADALEAWST